MPSLTPNAKPDTALDTETPTENAIATTCDVDVQAGEQREPHHQAKAPRLDGPQTRPLATEDFLRRVAVDAGPTMPIIPGRAVRPMPPALRYGQQRAPH